MATNATHKKRIFLAELARNGGRIPAAADVAEVDRGTPHRWAKKSAKFRQQMDDAIARATEVLEQEAIRRAYDGVEEPVYQQCMEVGKIKKYSDTLLIFLLKGRKPEVYKDRVKTEVTGADGGAIKVDVVSTARAALARAIGCEDAVNSETSMAGEPE